MTLEHSINSEKGKFLLHFENPSYSWTKAKNENLIHIVWNRSERQVPLLIDGSEKELEPYSIITLTYNNEIEVKDYSKELVIFSFNRDYYCIRDHDSEVSCNGVIFFGAQKQVLIQVNEQYSKKLNLLLEVFKDEFSQEDNIKGEMLVVLLKRLIILCTRLAKSQQGLDSLPHEDLEIIRKYNYLVDQKFKELKTVAEYADLLNRSPKTLSNIFSKKEKRSPLQIIHDRVILEGSRLLKYSDLNVNEVAFELGYNEPGVFFKLFKKNTGTSPGEFRKQIIPA